MGKTRPEKMDVDAATKKEKKHIDAKVTKHDRKDKKSKKTEKPSHQTESVPSDDEKSSKVGLTSPKQAQEIALALRPHPVCPGRRIRSHFSEWDHLSNRKA